MKFPWILRSDHDEQMRLRDAIIDTLKEALKERNWTIEKKDEEITALIGQLTLATPKTTEEQTNKDKKKPRNTLLGHSSWRARAQVASQNTIIAAGDSNKKLEEKVIREGGTV